MQNIKPTEIKFEEYIEKNLLNHGYISLSKNISENLYENYDRVNCLHTSQLIDFIKNSQSEVWEKLSEIHGSLVEEKVIQRVNEEITNRGLVDVLRGEVTDRGVKLKLFYPKPKSSLNPEALELYNKNQFAVMRQLRYAIKEEDKNNSIDMGLFVNGIPLITIELKNQLTGQNIENSENQYRYDRNPHEPLLKFKRCLAHFCIDNNKASMTTKLSGPRTKFLPFNKGIENPEVENDYRVEYMWNEIFTPDNLSEIIDNYVFVAEEEEYEYDEKIDSVEKKTTEVLIFPRYHQLDLIKNFKNTLPDDGVGTNYLVQHTTGSGKSYSIGWLAHTLTSLYKTGTDNERMFSSIIVVTDRKVLDKQLQNTIESIQRVPGVVNNVTQGAKQLKEFIEDGKAIIVTTIQKFPYIINDISRLSQKSFAVIIDEVHSSQTGELATAMKTALNIEISDDEDEIDIEEILNQQIAAKGNQEHISFFGFTGTPKEATLEVFGIKQPDGGFEPFHTYSMKQSIAENFTLDVLSNYTSYKRYFNITMEGQDYEVPSAKAKRKIIREVVLEDKLNIEQTVGIVLDHFFEKVIDEINGKARAMVVVPYRKDCVQYFKEVNKQLQQRKSDIRCLVGFSGDVSLDGDTFTERGLNATVGFDGEVPLGLKYPKNRLVVVANKYQTGFDEPKLQTMYINKPIKDVQSVQTLSRLNRTTSGKTQTFVLDFVNEPELIVKAFQSYYTSTVLEQETDPNQLYNNLTKAKEFLLFTDEQVTHFNRIFFDPNRTEGQLHPVLDEVCDQFSKLEENEQDEFKSYILSFMKAYGYLSQIITFQDTDLEKHYIFLKYLYKKIPKKTKEKFELDSSISLEDLRINKLRNVEANLNDEVEILNQLLFSPANSPDEVKDLLSEIINQVNHLYGIELDKDDLNEIEEIEEALNLSSEIKNVMLGDNTDENKKAFLKRQFEKSILDLVTKNMEMFKKLEPNQSAKNMIFQAIYKNYQNELRFN
ncbi:DEAD/DEAH box helicase family protein [Acidimicrobiia bacterium]|nr:DEAD/DEAH box helicase family protein [Acidimicrobiia bacterium]